MAEDKGKIGEGEKPGAGQVIHHHQHQHVHHETHTHTHHHGEDHGENKHETHEHDKKDTMKEKEAGEVKRSEKKSMGATLYDRKAKKAPTAGSAEKIA